MAGYRLAAQVLVILVALAIIASPAAGWEFEAAAPPAPPAPPAGSGYAGIQEVAISFFSPFFTGLPPVSITWVVFASLVIAGLTLGTIGLAVFGDRLSVAGTGGAAADREAMISQLKAELQARTEELEAAEESADLYLDTVNHNIVNMNHIAMGYLELASEKLPPGSEEKDLVDKPRDALEASTRFIRSLQSIQLARTGKLELKSVDLDTLLAGLAQEGGTTILYDRQPGSLAQGNELLPEAFHSVVQAATWLSTAPAAINIRLSGHAEAGRSYYRVTVESTGPGLPGPLKGRLFSPQRAGQPTGCIKGPGLYLARTVIEACGGKILAEDRIEGGLCEGCRFVVLLPAVDPTEAAPGTGSSAAGTGSPQP